jgi:hypothetical protein
MCTLYSITTNQEAIRALFRVTKDTAGNLPSMPAVFPDWVAPLDGRMSAAMHPGFVGA